MNKEAQPSDFSSRQHRRDESLARKATIEGICVVDALPRFPEVTDDEEMEFGGCSPSTLTALFGSEYVNLSEARQFTEFDKTIDTLYALSVKRGLEVIIPHSSSEFVCLMREEQTVGAFIGIDNNNTDYYKEIERAALVDVKLYRWPDGSGHAIAIIPFGSPDGDFGRSYMLVDTENGSQKDVLTDYGAVCEYSKAGLMYEDSRGENERFVYILRWPDANY